MKKCIRCKIEKDEVKFHTNLKQGTFYNECKVCMNTRNIVNLAKIKLDALAYKGICCQRCGVTGHPKIFDFHHRDPSQKDFAFSQARGRSIEQLKPELDKCDLLCSNCHRMVHHELLIQSGTINIELYNELITNEESILRIKPIVKHYCLCGAEVTSENRSCMSCAHKEQERIAWPSDEELAFLVWEKPRSTLAKELGVSDVAIAKRCRLRGIKMPMRGYWAKLSCIKCD